jgi:AraC-like DNA-binding protein
MRAAAAKYLDYHSTLRPVVAMEVDFPHGTVTGFHSHPRAQLLYAIEGVMIVSASRGYWVVPPNRAVWLVADAPHNVRMCGSVKIHTLYVDPDLSVGLPDDSCVLAVSPLLRELLVAAVRIPRDYDRDSRDERLLRLLLDELKTHDVVPLHLPMPENGKLRSLCQAIINSPENTATARQWAERIGVTAKTVQRMFMRETGCSFAQWRRQARLLRSLELLARGEKIIDVAYGSGYTSQSAFTAMFRKHFGITPSDFFDAQGN